MFGHSKWSPMGRQFNLLIRLMLKVINPNKSQGTVIYLGIKQGVFRSGRKVEQETRYADSGYVDVFEGIMDGEPHAALG